jgi:hypothetical protein
VGVDDEWAVAVRGGRRGRWWQGGGAFVDLRSALDALFDDVACAGAGGDDFEFTWRISFANLCEGGMD